MHGIGPISSVRQFSVGIGTAANSQENSSDTKSLAENALHALSESNAADAKEVDQYVNSDEFKDLTTSSLIKFNELSIKQHLKVQVLSRVSSELGSAFKTVTQQ